MNAIVVSVFISLGSLVLSVLIVAFTVGRTYAEIKADVKQIRTDLAKIEGMFVVRIRDEYIDKPK